MSSLTLPPELFTLYHRAESHLSANWSKTHQDYWPDCKTELQALIAIYPLLPPNWTWLPYSLGVKWPTATLYLRTTQHRPSYEISHQNGHTTTPSPTLAALCLSHILSEAP